MPKKIPKAEWDKVADFWNEEAGDKGVWHQQHDIARATARTTRITVLIKTSPLTRRGFLIEVAPCQKKTKVLS